MLCPSKPLEVPEQGHGHPGVMLCKARQILTFSKPLGSLLPLQPQRTAWQRWEGP